jgi:TRAP-type C4-dicarboxylate transport system substrate-binding protein
VSLWPETTVLLVNPDRLAELTDTQIGWLQEAAADAAARSAGLHDVDARMLADACERGSRFANASDADLAALDDALAPVYAALEEDPQTQELIEQIHDLKESVSPETLDIPDGCTGEAPAP